MFFSGHNVETIEPNPGSTLSIRARNPVIGILEYLSALLAIVLIAAGAVFVRLASALDRWVIFILATKPIVDLTWRWELFEIVHQRVNFQAILAILVTVMNGLAALQQHTHPRHAKQVAFFLAMATFSVIITPTSWGVNELLRLYAGVSFFFTAGLVLAKERQFHRFARIFLGLLCVPLVLSIFQVLGLLPYEYWDWVANTSLGRASGTYQHPSEIVFFLVYAVPIAFYCLEKTEKGWTTKVLLFFFFPLAFLGLIFTYHRAGWIVTLTQTLLWHATRKQFTRILIGALALVVLLGAFIEPVQELFKPATELVNGQADFASGNFLRGRGANWFVFFGSYAAGGPLRWVIGKGGSVAEVSFSSVMDFSENEPHNDFIRVLHAYGLLGLILYLSLLFRFFKDGTLLRRSQDMFHRNIGKILLCSLIGIFLLSLTTEPMRYPTGIWYLFVLASVAACLKKWPEKEMPYAAEA